MGDPAGAITAPGPASGQNYPEVYAGRFPTKEELAASDFCPGFLADLRAGKLPHSAENDQLAALCEEIAGESSSPYIAPVGITAAIVTAVTLIAIFRRRVWRTLGAVRDVSYRVAEALGFLSHAARDVGDAANALRGDKTRKKRPPSDNDPTGTGGGGGGGVKPPPGTPPIVPTGSARVAALLQPRYTVYAPAQLRPFRFACR